MHVHTVSWVKPPSHPTAFSFSSEVVFMVEITIIIIIIIIIIERVNDNGNSDNA